MMMHMCGGKKCGPAMIAYILLIIGGLNWGLEGLSALLGTNLNVVNLLVGTWPTVEAIVYLLVGISAIVMLVGCRCSTCSSGTCMMKDDGMMMKK